MDLENNSKLADSDLVDLKIRNHKIIICEGHWKLNFLWEIHIHCKNLNTVLEEKFSSPPSSAEVKNRVELYLYSP
jgi:hypothetical protein